MLKCLCLQLNSTSKLLFSSNSRAQQNLYICSRVFLYVYNNFCILPSPFLIPLISSSSSSTNASVQCLVVNVRRQQEFPWKRTAASCVKSKQLNKKFKINANFVTKHNLSFILKNRKQMQFLYFYVS